MDYDYLILATNGVREKRDRNGIVPYITTLRCLDLDLDCFLSRCNGNRSIVLRFFLRSLEFGDD